VRYELLSFTIPSRSCSGPFTRERRRSHDFQGPVYGSPVRLALRAIQLLKSEVNKVQRLFSCDKPHSFTSQHQPRLVHNILKTLSKFHTAGKLALHTRRGVFSLFERSPFGRQGITKAIVCSAETKRRDSSNDLCRGKSYLLRV
jgi:hypothetical protein